MKAANPKRSLSADSVLGGVEGCPIYNVKEVADHRSADDAWMIIKDKVYDVTDFVARHPGGKVILTYAGRDATDVFSTFHAASTWSLLRPMYVGELEDFDGKAVPTLLRDFRAMRASFLKGGLFKSNKLYYVWKLLSTFSLLGGAVATLLAARESMLALVASAFLLGLFWQQTGWLAHDFLHHQVFQQRWINNCIGLFLGNVAQGFSVDWWKTKHNTHHAAPNELQDGAHTVDPDIDTLPLLAWSVEQLDSMKNKTIRTILRMQHYFFFPILLFARMSWCTSSVLHANDLSKVESSRGWQELLGLGLHYSWYLGMVFSWLPPAKAVLFLVLSQMFAGFLLSIVFVQSHNAMEVYVGPKDFITAQMVSTRDINAGLFNDWFTGGLNYQIEHHLFPTLPRHNLGKVKEAIMELCTKHGLVYESVGMGTGTAKVLQRLADIAAQA